MWLPTIQHAMASANTYREILAIPRTVAARDILMQEVIALSDEVIRLRHANEEMQLTIAELNGKVLVLTQGRQAQTNGV